MGELGDWGYFVLFAISVLMALLYGFGKGCDYGYKKGYIQGREDAIAEKEKMRHIDASA